MFRMEIKEIQKLPFLDLLVHKKELNSIGPIFFSKKPHKNRYLNAKSHHHLEKLQTVWKTLVIRSQKLADPKEGHKKVLLQHQKEIKNFEGEDVEWSGPEGTTILDQIYKALGSWTIYSDEGDKESLWPQSIKFKANFSSRLTIYYIAFSNSKSLKIFS